MQEPVGNLDGSSWSTDLPPGGALFLLVTVCVLIPYILLVAVPQRASQVHDCWSIALDRLKASFLVDAIVGPLRVQLAVRLRPVVQLGDDVRVDDLLLGAAILGGLQVDLLPPLSTLSLRGVTLAAAVVRPM